MRSRQRISSIFAAAKGNAEAVLVVIVGFHGAVCVESERLLYSTRAQRAGLISERNQLEEVGVAAGSPQNQLIGGKLVDQQPVWF